jgi:Fe-S cluster biogenesis protein NfuA/nitrite reductase/ring-hydroxylating ferredoxin subunit
MMEAGTDQGRSLSDLLGTLQRIETVVAGWEQEPRATAEAYRRAVEALHSEAFRRIVRALRKEPSALAALKSAAEDDVVYATLRQLELIKPSLTERVEAALAGIRPTLASHGGDVRLVRVSPPIAEVEMVGSCSACTAAALTFQAGIVKAVRDACPEIRDVVQARPASPSAPVQRASPFAGAATGQWDGLLPLSAVPDRSLRCLEHGGESLVVYRTGQTVTCFENACAHLGRTIHDGSVDNGVLTCRHHGFQYDLGSGACLTAPGLRLRERTVRITEGMIEIRSGEGT